MGGRDRRRLAEAQALLDQLTDLLGDIRLDIELRAAAEGAAWHEGPAGRAARQVIEELDGNVRVLGRMTLPDMEMLR